MTLREYLMDKLEAGKFMTGKEIQNESVADPYRSPCGGACVYGHAANYYDKKPFDVECDYYEVTEPEDDEGEGPILLNDKRHFKEAIEMLCDGLEPVLVGGGEE